MASVRQLCHLTPCLPQLAPAMHEMEVVLLSHLQWRSPVFPGNTESHGSQVSLLETAMVIGMGHSQMPQDLQGHSSCLVGWGCGPPSGYWFQVSDHLGYSIWWILTPKQWPWIETLDEFIHFGCKGLYKKIRKTNGLAVTASFPQWVGDPLICHQWIPSQMWGHFLPGNRADNCDIIRWCHCLYAYIEVGGYIRQHASALGLSSGFLAVVHLVALS